MNALAIPRVKQVLRLCAAQSWRDLARHAMSYATAAEVKRFVDQELVRHFGAMFAPAPGGAAAG
jgi:phosphotransferase system enzyme I (PtsI)